MKFSPQNYYFLILFYFHTPKNLKESEKNNYLYEMHLIYQEMALDKTFHNQQETFPSYKSILLVQWLYFEENSDLKTTFL